MAVVRTHLFSTCLVFTTSWSKSSQLVLIAIADFNRTRYSSMMDDERQNERTQVDIMTAFTKIACAGSRCLEPSQSASQPLQSLVCMLCDANSRNGRDAAMHWNEQDDAESWKDAIAAMLAITKEPEFEASSQSRVLMAVAIGLRFSLN